MQGQNSCLHDLLPLIQSEELTSIPFRLDPFCAKAHPICVLAVGALQEYLLAQNEFEHNFGLGQYSDVTPIGKMLGVLVVRDTVGALFYLAAYSGKLAGTNSHSYFVPPVYDGLQEDGFLSKGMLKLQELSQRIETCSLSSDAESIEKVSSLKEQRKRHSRLLQDQLFDEYVFLNQSKQKKSLKSIFLDYCNRRPPTAAGECAAPKLFQFAFENDLEPLAISEFWWGASTRSAEMIHGEFYPSCEDKCRPILDFMLT